MKKEVLYLSTASILVIGALFYKVIEIRGYERRDELAREVAAEKTRKEEAARYTKKARLDSCLAAAESAWWSSWELNCSSNFKYNDDGDLESCSVPTHLAKRIDDEKQGNKENCIELYK